MPKMKMYPILSVAEREERAQRHMEGHQDNERVELKPSKAPRFRNPNLQTKIEDRLREIDPLFTRVR